MIKNNRILIIGTDNGSGYEEILLPNPAPADTEGRDQKKSLDLATVYEVSMAKDETEALELVKTSVSTLEPFAILFLETGSLPGTGMAEFQRQIHSIDPFVKLVISGHPDKFPAGAISDDKVFFLKKPFYPGEIIRISRSLIHERDLEKKTELLETRLQEANNKMADMNRDLREKVEKQAAMIVQAEKMASVGLLAAGVAHEINNPISYINSNLFAVKKYFGKINGLYKEYLEAECLLETLEDEKASQIIQKIKSFKSENKIQMIMDDLEIIAEESIDGINRVKNIVSNLKTFSRIDEAEYKPININHAMETTLDIIWNEIKYKAEVERDFQDLPEIKCFPQKISQVFMNLLINAAQAIEDKGKIHITTRMVTRGKRKEDRFVQIRISDTGAGIPKENLGKIFDPFFTTKPVGQGTGLGLSIVYEIVKVHGGRIDVVSRPGKGTRFTLHLPAASGPNP
ncbi:hybrid sensor histidine kinase/response regulator [Desulfospira joergensenii]|uniref:hybrid sensor histidine kinase/response regulator n=1 Tax=Desulfospira joergensenii TaxID=53329 RepID=UPI001379034E|nr:ATP-binding protein [Desulfospira joergensenii]